MLRPSFATALTVLALSPGALLAACGDGEEDGEDMSGASGSAGSSPRGGKSAAGDAAGGASAAGASAASGNSSGGDRSAAGDGGAGGLAPVVLGAARNYAIVAKSAISNVPTSVITGDLGLSPAAATYITGFALTKAGASWTSPQVTGLVFAANNDPPTPSELTAVVADMQTAYADAAGRPSPDFVELGGGALDGLTLSPGLYKWTSAVTIQTDITLEGGAKDVWIFQVSGELKLASATSMILSGGADPTHIFWQVAGAVELGTTSHAEGIVLSKTAITLRTGASMNGRLLAQTAVILDGATVTAP